MTTTHARESNLTFSALLKGERFTIRTAAPGSAPPVYTKVAKNVCKDSEGQWLTIKGSTDVVPGAYRERAHKERAMSESTTTTNFQRFADLYRVELEQAVQAQPADYPWYPTRPVATVADKMIAAFAAGTYNKDSGAIRRVCRTLGIKHTYTAINSFLRSEQR